MQNPIWKIDAVSISVLRRQYDKAHVTATFDNRGRSTMLNFIVVNGPDG